MKKLMVLAFSLFLILQLILAQIPDVLELTFCDVGQGDATLLKFDQIQMLIDTGPNDKVLSCLEHQLPFWDKRIEFLVLTHRDLDHIGGTPQVLDHYKVDFIFINTAKEKKSDFSHLESSISRAVASGTKLLSTFPGQEIKFTKDIEIEVINPGINFPQVEETKTSRAEVVLSDKIEKNLSKKLEKISENNLSIALKVMYKQISIILPGDLEKEGELAVMNSGLLSKSAMLKAGHHGSKSSSSPQFIEVLQPEVTVISSGKNNAYNHPNPQVVSRFMSFGVSLYQTKLSSELNFATDGDRFWQFF